MLRVLVVPLQFLLLGATASNVYTEPAIFERLSHFAAYGVPGTTNDPLNQAMIADASCRLISENGNGPGGYSYYRNRQATTAVISAYQNLPSTAGPSHFTLSAHDIFAKACTINNTLTLQQQQQQQQQCSVQPLSGLTSAMDAWHRALCANSNDPSWKGTFDPAYQPQQVALTVGFMCIVSCDCAETALSSKTMAAFAANDQMASDARDSVCHALPFHTVNFTKQASSPSLLAHLSMPIRKLCECEK